jgi:acetyl esterase/lipase
VLGADGARASDPAARQPDRYAVRQALDLAYEPGKDPQKLDVFSPEGLKDRPVVFLVHGGAWMIGDKDFFGLYRNVGKALARHGVVTVMVNYRLSPAVRHPAHVEHLARAFAWTRRHIKEYGGNPDRIVLVGHSAGGHLVALLATDDRYLKARGLHLDDADRAAIRGVVGVSGVYHVPATDELVRMATAMLQGMGQPGPAKLMPTPAHSTRMAGNWMAVAVTTMRRSGMPFDPFDLVFGRDPRERLAASPITYVRPGLPPFLLLHASSDLPTLPEQAREFAQALEKAGNSVTLERMSPRDHNTILFDAAQDGDPVLTAILHFVARHP